MLTGLELLDKILEDDPLTGSSVPKSVQSMTKTYLPLVAKDFPSFHFDALRRRVEEQMRNCFLAIEKQDVQLLPDASLELKQYVQTILDNHIAKNIVQSFSQIQFHRTEIVEYIHQPGQSKIILQSAIGYEEIAQKVNEGTLSSAKQETLYNIEVIYVQDTAIMKEKKGQALNCPNCGAPISVKTQTCPYCSGETVSTYVWNIHKFERIA